MERTHNVQTDSGSGSRELTMASGQHLQQVQRNVSVHGNEKVCVNIHGSWEKTAAASSLRLKCEVMKQGGGGHEDRREDMRTGGRT
ncbi:hypothetical protein EYF80_060467 [Liparis tanakae]|uniref:Uncharacterized protein n=1 Tax=Liparis tanakae TaxID=230148 RepID=A0A4Z2ELS1_9TELE|nr:hypothetical protein EYF80_060467 [Liparis tanakae]